jgi:hypothetical protein
MYRKLTSLLWGLALLAPLGASAEEPAAAAPAATVAATGNTGTVIFFREKKFAGSAIRYKVRENGAEICKLKSGSYCTVQTSVGKHDYVVHSEAKDVLTLEVESGETYYVIGGISIGFLAGHPNLSPSDQATYEKMLPKMADNTGKDLNSDERDDKDEKEGDKK